MNRKVLCRKADLEDLDRIAAIEAGGFREDFFSRRQLRYLIRDAKGACFAAVLHGTVAGYISLLTRGGKNGRIYSLAVDPEFRGRGIAELLVETALDFSRREGLRAVFLEVAVDNAPAISLYRKKGFVIRSLKSGYYHSGGDAYSMVFAFL